MKNYMFFSTISRELLRSLFFAFYIAISSFSFISCDDCDVDDPYCEEDDEEEDDCDPKPISCHSSPYTSGYLDINITLNDDNPTVEVTVYRGNVEDNNVVQVLNMSSTSVSLNLPVGDYSATCAYLYKGYMIQAIDGDSIESNKEEYCEGSCYELDNGEIDLKFDRSAFDDYLDEKDDNCFIATATYGSLLEEEVVTLRNFRDKYLLTNITGKIFVKVYYKYSPPLANIIRDNNYLKSISRSILTPIVYMIKYPVWFFISMIFVLYGIFKLYGLQYNK